MCMWSCIRNNFEYGWVCAHVYEPPLMLYKDTFTQMIRIEYWAPKKMNFYQILHQLKDIRSLILLNQQFNQLSFTYFPLVNSNKYCVSKTNIGKQFVVWNFYVFKGVLATKQFFSFLLP